MSGSGSLGLDVLALPGWGVGLALSAVTMDFDSLFISLGPIFPFKPSCFNIILLPDIFQLFKK
jgi:hypothetical protein